MFTKQPCFVFRELHRILTTLSVRLITLIHSLLPVKGFLISAVRTTEKTYFPKQDIREITYSVTYVVTRNVFNSTVDA